MHYIVFDLEASCWEKREGQLSEIIEIGALKLDSEGKAVGEFSSFIKPVLNPRLSDFCIGLTGIAQEQVDEAEGFPAVFSDFREWMGQGPFWLCAWGGSDRVMLINDCKRHGFEFGFLASYANLRLVYARKNRRETIKSLSHTLEKEGLTFEGEAHRAINDAKSLAKLLQKFFVEWSALLANREDGL